jgi:Flp pilus assembly protein CpaB
MIRNEAAFRRQAERDAVEHLRGLTVEESIAIGEALLTSDIMRLAAFTDQHQPSSLAIALGIAPRPGGSRAACPDGGE